MKHLAFAFLFLTSLTEAAVNPDPIFQCTLGKKTVDTSIQQGKNWEEDEVTKTLVAKAGERVEQNFPGYEIVVHVCNQVPAGEIDIIITDSLGRVVGETMADASGPRFAHYSELRVGDSHVVQLYAYCAKEE